MTNYLGIDKSVLEVDEHGNMRVYYSITAVGKKLQDVTSLSFEQAMWVRGLEFCGLYAIDVWRIDTTAPIRERELIIGQLLRDIENYTELERNISALMHFTMDGNPCDYRVLSKCQKHLTDLKESISERRSYIEDSVYSTVERTYRNTLCIC